MFDLLTEAALSPTTRGEAGLVHLVQAVSYFESDPEPTPASTVDLSAIEAMYAYFEAA